MSETATLNLTEVVERASQHDPPGSLRHDAYCKHTKRRVFVQLRGESMLENFMARVEESEGGRPAKPVDLLRPVVKAYLMGRGIPTKGMRWSSKAGCSCPCSPGFIVAETGPSIYLTYEVHKGHAA